MFWGLRKAGDQIARTMNITTKVTKRPYVWKNLRTLLPRSLVRTEQFLIGVVQCQGHSTHHSSQVPKFRNHEARAGLQHWKHQLFQLQEEEIRIPGNPTAKDDQLWVQHGGDTHHGESQMLSEAFEYLKSRR